MAIRDDRAYFARRAAIERAAADACEDAGVAATHRQMAEAYEQRLAAMPVTPNAARDSETEQQDASG